jgi:hypothetical protein
MIETLLSRWLEADKNAAQIKAEIDALEIKLHTAKREAESAAFEIQQEMADTGEYEILVQGEYTDYKIYWGGGRESVKVENPDAVPDEFCKIERKPKLREIAEHLKTNQVNWAAVEKGSQKLNYKLVKKGSK